jgi:hypothetical protein
MATFTFETLYVEGHGMAFLYCDEKRYCQAPDKILYTFFDGIVELVSR